MKQPAESGDSSSWFRSTLNYWFPRSPALAFEPGADTPRYLLNLYAQSSRNSAMCYRALLASLPTAGLAAWRLHDSSAMWFFVGLPVVFAGALLWVHQEGMAFARSLAVL